MTKRLTTGEAANLAGMTPATFRRTMHRLRTRERNPVDYRLPEDQWYPGDNPAWNAREIQAWAERRQA